VHQTFPFRNQPPNLISKGFSLFFPSQKIKVESSKIEGAIPINGLIPKNHEHTCHIIKCDCHLPKRKVEARSLLVPPLYKCTDETVVNQAVAGILKPRQTGALQSVTPPPCNHDKGGLFIMHHFYLLSTADAF